MVRLYRIDLPTQVGQCTVWAARPEQALVIARGSLGQAVEHARAVDITQEQIDPENPYRDFSLAVIARGRIGRAHLRLTSHDEGSGWYFHGEPDSQTPDQRPDSTAHSLCA